MIGRPAALPPSNGEIDALLVRASAEILAATAVTATIAERGRHAGRSVELVQRAGPSARATSSVLRRNYRRAVDTTFKLFVELVKRAGAP